MSWGVLLRGQTLGELYPQLLAAIRDDGQPVAPRGLPTRELLAVTLVIEQPNVALLDDPVRVLNPAFAVAERRRAGWRPRYAPSMEPTRTGELVKVAGGGPPLDGIVFDMPSRSKIVVAVVDPGRGPVFRTVHPSTLSERTTEGPDDRALRLLIRRTPPPTRGAARDEAGAGRGRPGHARGTMHRTTGK